MKQDELEPLPDILSKAFEAERSRVDDDPVMKEVVLRNVERAAVLAGSPDVDAPAPPAKEIPSASALSTGTKYLLTKKALGAIVVGSFTAGALTGGAALTASHSESRSAPAVGPAVVTEMTDAAHAAMVPEATLDSGAEIVAPADTPLLPRPAPVDGGRGSLETSTSTTTISSDLARERELIDMARAALSRGRPEVALEAIERHQRSFPRGTLREERDAIRIQALAAEGRRAEAEQAVKQFHRSYPSSVMSDVVDSALIPSRAP